MPWASRNISPDEKAALLGRLAPYPDSARQGCIATTAYYGTHLILIPLVGGGFLGGILRLIGVPGTPAYVAGLTVATVASLAILGRRRRAEMRQREAAHRRRASAEAGGTFPIFTIRVVKAWLIDSEPDWPSYLFKDPDQGFVLLSTDLLQFEPPTFARGELEVTFAPPDRDTILQLRWSGPAVPVEEPVLPIPDDGWPGDGALTILSPEAIPGQWRSIVDAG